MEDKISNRMAKGGRPTNEEIAKREPFKPAEPAEVRLPPVMGFIAPCCGRAVNPTIIRTTGNKRTLRCDCGKLMTAIYSEGKPPLIQLI